MQPILTKSQYIDGLQCPKLLWTQCHEKQKIPLPDEAQKHIFEQGYEIGELAKKLVKKGIEIKADSWNLIDCDEKTRKALSKRKPLFEAGLIAKDIFSRADILVPVKKNEWDMLEVKSGTSLKEVHIHDVSFQKYCFEKAGVKIRKCFIVYVNNEFIKKGKINPKKFFIQDDVTEKVNEAIKGIHERINGMIQIILSKTSPDIRINPNCSNPYDCPLEEDCWKSVPPNSVFDLRSGGRKAFDLYYAGTVLIKDIPEKFELNDKQRIQVECAKARKAHIDKESIKHFLEQLKYPLYFLDFETFSTAIPLFDGIKPYQNIPFQFSLHVIEKEGDKPKHYSFIAEGKKDPRKAVFEKLKESIGKRGSVLVYNHGFEQGILKDLAKAFPKYKKWLALVIERIVDLMLPFKNFNFYDSRQEGSTSLKFVLPTLTGKSYKNMEINNGANASLKFLYITHGLGGKKATPQEAKKIRKDLEDYCGLDTEGMIWILEKLEGLFSVRGK